MNLILLFENDFVEPGERVVLTGRRHRHVTKVHRASAGDTLCVGMADGRMGTGRILELGKSALTMAVTLDTPPPPPLPLKLVLALPRPKVLKRLLVAISSMGVKEIVLVNAYRVEKSYWQSPALTEKRLTEQLILGLEQAKDTRLPTVKLRPRFKPFVEDELPELIGGTLPLVAHPGGGGPCPRDVGTPVTLAVGPEGGFIPYEVEKLAALGFTPVHLGERILRVGTAVPVLLSRLF